MVSLHSFISKLHWRNYGGQLVSYFNYFFLQINIMHHNLFSDSTSNTFISFFLTEMEQRSSTFFLVSKWRTHSCMLSAQGRRRPFHRTLETQCFWEGCCLWHSLHSRNIVGITLSDLSRVSPNVSSIPKRERERVRERKRESERERG